LYFLYEGKEAYIDLNIEENKSFYDIINEIKKRFDFIPNDANNFYLMKKDNMINIDIYKGVKENNLKNGDKICIIIYNISSDINNIINNTFNYTTNNNSNNNNNIFTVKNQKVLTN
jgi:hypothetical protein